MNFLFNEGTAVLRLQKMMLEISPFNAVFFAIMGIFAALIIGIWYIFRNKSENAKRGVIVGICAFNIVFYFIYKYCLSKDTQFLEITQLERFNWFKELPMQLCNINMFLIPISLIIKKRAVYGFSFFIGPLAAFMALIFPEKAFDGYSLLLMRNMGYYVTHGLILVCAVSLATLGFFKPKFRDIPGTVVALIVISSVIHAVNIFLRTTVCPEANYFFTYGADISILNLFWNWIPVPYLYEMPAMLILLPYMLIITSVFEFSQKRKPKSMQCEELSVSLENEETEPALKA